MKKRIAIMLIIMALSVSAMSLTAHAADALKGVWANSSGSVMYMFDGNGGGSMEHASHTHKITYTVDGKNLKISFPDNDGHGLSDTFTFELEGDLLKLTIEGKTAAQRYEKKADDWKRPENTNPNRQNGNTSTPGNSDGGSNNTLLWLLIGGGGGALIAVIACLIVFKKMQRRNNKQRTATRRQNFMNEE
jgi:hypothetical protein